MHINRFEAGLVHHIRSLDMRVDALLTQNRNSRANAAGDVGRSDILGHVETDFWRDARIGFVE